MNATDGYATSHKAILGFPLKDNIRLIVKRTQATLNIFTRETLSTGIRYQCSVSISQPLFCTDMLITIALAERLGRENDYSISRTTLAKIRIQTNAMKVFTPVMNFNIYK